MCVSALGLQSIVDMRSREIEIVDKNGNKTLFEPNRVLELISLVCNDIDDDSKAEALYSRIEYSIFGGMTDNQLKMAIINAAEFYSQFDQDFIKVTKKLNSKLKIDGNLNDRAEKLVGFSNLLS